MRGTDHLEHALPVQRLIQDCIDSVTGVAQCFLRISRYSIDNKGAGGGVVAAPFQYPLSLRVIKAQHTSLKLLAIQQQNRIGISRHHHDAELPEAIIEESVTGGINMDA